MKNQFGMWKWAKGALSESRLKTEKIDPKFRDPKPAMMGG